MLLLPFKKRGLKDFAVAIKLESKGQIFFKQERLGLNQKPFTLMEFRSMMEDAEKETGPVWAKRDDPRVTRVGKLLRKTGLDEFPELINVLKGDLPAIASLLAQARPPAKRSEADGRGGRV